MHNNSKLCLELIKILRCCNSLFEEIEIISKLVTEVIERRIELGLSQRDLATISGVKQPAIARFETLGTIPRLDTLIKILKALGLKINIIFDEEAVTA